MKQTYCKTKQKTPKKVFSVSFSESYQAQIPSGHFLCHSKYHLLKSLALAAAVTPNSKKTPMDQIAWHGSEGYFLSKISACSLLCTFNTTKPTVTFPKENSDLKEDSGKNWQCSKAESFRPTALIHRGISTSISPTSNQFYTA